MKCPYCEHQDSKVVDSRSINDGVRRRRQCLRCGSRFTTYERAQTSNFMVIKKDGRREEFNRVKLIDGIRKACAKRPVASEAIEELVDRIEDELQQLGKVEVPSSTIGGLVISHLGDIDRIAYIRFSSVYQEFADVEHFKQAVDTLAQSHQKISTAQLPLIPQESPLLQPSKKRDSQVRKKKISSRPK